MDEQQGKDAGNRPRAGQRTVTRYWDAGEYQVVTQASPEGIGFGVEPVSATYHGMGRDLLTTRSTTDVQEEVATLVDTIHDALRECLADHHRMVP